MEVDGNVKPMKDSKWILIIVLAICIVFLFILISKANAEVISRNDSLYIQTAKEVASAHNYSYDVPGVPNYICGNFAWDLTQSLIKEGYIVKIKEGRWMPISTPYGWNTCSAFNYKYFRCEHYWVLVEVGTEWIPIESTGGYVIDPITYKKDYT
jgi:hypothetical protein